MDTGNVLYVNNRFCSAVLAHGATVNTSAMPCCSRGPAVLLDTISVMPHLQLLQALHHA